MILSEKKIRTTVYLFTFIVGILVPILFAYTYTIPVPHIHDEFAYLLQGDTFANARLSNPTHPMHRFFETFHVFHLPTYQAKYPPGQGLFLALGEIFYSLPAAGVWLSCGLACLALCWLLTACIPPLWALSTTLLFLLNPTVLISWSQSYWGGYVAFIGGALFFGSLFRLMSEVKLSTSILLVLGIFILSISRPAEGLLTVAIALPFLFWSWKNKNYFNEGNRLPRKFFIPLLIGTLAIISFQLIYNHALSGNPLIYSYFNWTYKDSSIDLIRNYTGSMPLNALTELTRVYTFFYTPFLGLILAALIFVKDKKIVTLALLWIVIQTTVSVLFTKAWPHYMAPTAPLHYILIGSAFYAISSKIFKGQNTGKLIASGIYTIFIFHFVSTLFIITKNDPPLTWGLAKQNIITELKEVEPKDLIFVRYSNNHNVHSEWVYNEADIDKSQVIWARDLGDEENKKLIAYYPKRDIWVLEPDKRPMALTRQINR